MKAKSILLIVLTGLIISCQQNKPTDSPEELKQVLLDYFDGIKNKDFDKMKEVTTIDFAIYEDGKVWNNDSIISFIKMYPNSKVDYTFDNFKIKVDNSSGNMHYLNHADFILNDTIKMEFNWIESATFIKNDNGWKMDFLHSTVRK